jgi:hypothetical protein
MAVFLGELVSEEMLANVAAADQHDHAHRVDDATA